VTRLNLASTHDGNRTSIVGNMFSLICVTPPCKPAFRAPKQVSVRRACGVNLPQRATRAAERAVLTNRANPGSLSPNPKRVERDANMWLTERQVASPGAHKPKFRRTVSRIGRCQLDASRAHKSRVECVYATHRREVRAKPEQVAQEQCGVGFSCPDGAFLSDARPHWLGRTVAVCASWVQPSR
jgi:hypothetical protein